MALDIGGANIKVATMKEGPDRKYRPDSAIHVFPIWQRANELAGFLKTIFREHPGCELAVTLTAELADVFPTKREGVVCVLRAVQEAFPGPGIQVLTVDGRLESIDDVLNDPLPAAGANWAASAWVAAQIFPEGILGDTGSTTTDLIPFKHGHIASVGKTDPERLASGELVYTGCLRTPCSHLAPKVPWRGGYCRVSPEYFTIAGDVHLILGNIQADDYHWPTPDGRGTTLHNAKARLSRLVCGDAEMLTDGEILGLARYLYHRQIEQVAEALYQVLSKLQNPVPLICAGGGRFLLEAAAASVGLETIGLENVCGIGQVEVFPAWSLCLMLAAQQEGMKVFDQFRADH
jgi:probable H4MPT-linked C1 transfer pathway protein